MLDPSFVFVMVDRYGPEWAIGLALDARARAYRPVGVDSPFGCVARVRSPLHWQSGLSYSAPAVS